MAEATAWVLALEGGLWAAVGEHEMIHIVQAPRLFAIPDTPGYCRQVLRWEDAIVPVIDVAAWLRGESACDAPGMVGIFAFQTPADMGYGALPLQVIPARRRVRDQQACALPTEWPGWARIALSCFKDGDRETPILDLSTLFSDALLSAPPV